MKLEKLDELIGKSDQPEKMAKIVQQLKDSKFNDSFFTLREISKLPKLLKDDEAVKFAASGIYDNDGCSVLIVVTDKRILLENKKLLFGSQNTEIPLEMVNDISYNAGLLMAKISIISGTKEHKVSNVLKENVQPLADTIRKQTELIKNSRNDHSSNQQTDSEQLKALKELVDSGILTQEEFEAKKKQILGI